MMAIVAKPKKHVSPRLINAMMVGITRRNSEFHRTSECDAFVDRVPGNDDINASMSADESMQQDLFGEQNVQKTLELRDVMSQQGDAQEDQQAEEPNHDLGPYSHDSASDKDDNDSAAVESECSCCSIVDETVRPSPMKMRTRSKARRAYVEPEPVMCSDSEDDEPCPRQRKRNHAIATPLRAGGTSKYFRSNSNKFPSIASKTFGARKSRAGKKGTK